MPPLALPAAGNGVSSVDALRQHSAVALFNERAAAVAPTSSLPRSTPTRWWRSSRGSTACRSRSSQVARKLLQPQAILPRLQKRLQLLTGGAQDLPGRQQTMRNAIDWSYGLLTPDEQQFFRKLSVFVGGWTWRPPRPCAPGDYSDLCSRA